LARAPYPARLPPHLSTPRTHPPPFHSPRFRTLARNPSFDGQAGGKEETRRGSLAILYASAGQTADSIIERIAQAYATEGEIGVVTADHAEMTAVESLGAFGFSPDWLRDELRVASQELSESITQYRKKKFT